MTTNLLIAFGGVAVLGIVGGVVAWLAYAAANREEAPNDRGQQPGAEPGAP